MLKPLFIKPSIFIGNKLNKISICNIDKKVQILKTFYENNHSNTKESSLPISNLLRDLFYNSDNYKILEKESFNNQKGEIDLAIQDLDKEEPKNEVIFELKKPNSSEMIEKNDFFRKSFYQAIYYYLSDKKDNEGLSSIRYIIITDNVKWFFIRAKDLDDALFNKVDINQHYISYNITEKLTKECYSSIEKFLQNVCDRNTSETESLFDSSNDTTIPYTFFNLRDLINQNKEDELQLLISFLSDSYLLNKVDMVEKNSLHKKFYEELLYIIGLEEKTDSNKVTLQKIDNDFSFMSLIHKEIKDSEIYENLEDGQINSVALELSLIWVNRLMFIKLFSSVLETYKVIKTPILDLMLEQKLSIFHSANDLFFEVLNVPKEERGNSLFKNIPYINSSLFQKEDIEIDYLTIKRLSDNKMAELWHKIDKKDNKKFLSSVNEKYDGSINILQYFIHFLNSYNIAVDENFSDNSDKDLINASVLGKIFEKINGYQDGAYYTPSYIAEYMSKELVQQRLLLKFRDYGFEAKDINSLKKEIFIDEKEEEANQILSSLTTCDPAVGSGHLLVSILNSIIFYKCQLGLFNNIKPNQLEIIDDSLVINNITQYTIDKASSYNQIHNIYQELYQSKSEIICNSIFGVDINSSSVKISRLRLWIELLKHTYFTEESQFKDLVLLPNIDINIKQGNSLVSKYPLTHTFNEKTLNVNTYKQYKSCINEYKRCLSKKEKKSLLNKILELKKELIVETSSNSFEWRFEFPETLDNGGNFVGFDIIIGNPPYIRHEKIKELKPYLKNCYSTYHGSADLYVYFYELGNKLLKDNGLLGYICSNKFFKANYGKELRDYILTKTKIKSVSNFKNEQIFDTATVASDIMILEKGKPSKESAFCILSRYLSKDFTVNQKDLNANAFIFIDSKENMLKTKIEEKGKLLKNWGTPIKSGIKTGLNEAFIIDTKTKNKLLQKDPNNQKIIEPYLRGRNLTKYAYQFCDEWLLNIHNNPVVNIDEYPTVKEYLSTYYEKLKKRSDQGATPYNLRNCAYIEDFKKEKLIWMELSNTPKFTIDTNGHYVDMTTFFIQSNDIYYLLPLMNSKLITWYFDLICNESGVGTNRWKKTYIENLPIIKASKKEEAQLINFGKEIMSLKSNDFCTKEIEKKVDLMIYKLYGLSQPEIEIIENFNA